MRISSAPAVNVASVLDRLSSGVRIDTVHASRSMLIRAEKTYNYYLSQQAATNVPTVNAGISSSTAKSVRWAYKNHLRSRKSAGREIYALLRSLADLCPTCRVRDAVALDHYLPKETYPTYAIQPTNLVPICTSCNDKKWHKQASSIYDQFLHPYFDDLHDDSWLIASAVRGAGRSVTYSVAAQHFSDPILQKRVEFHLEFFGLSLLYASKASTYVGGHIAMLQDAHAKGDPEHVSDFLFTLSSSVQIFGEEPWVAAALAAWAADLEFCDEGWY
ncbi:putative lambdoid prophage protein [Clavibacter sepedonicus]|uniref:Lambdoid prophage protein n=1 Tax=Clavibacter sepedonicus TaxID=31964 RepID=B0RHQ0_CLASE|nr:putative lambdoid prophage protein [Clavibacter sepedonicus]